MSGEAWTATVFNRHGSRRPHRITGRLTQHSGRAVVGGQVIDCGSLLSLDIDETFRLAAASPVTAEANNERTAEK